MLHFHVLILIRAEGDHIKVTASKYPFPTVCADNQSTDWFHAISRTLKWNERERQKSFVVVEESPTRKSRASDTQGGPTPTAREHKGVAKENGDDEAAAKAERKRLKKEKKAKEAAERGEEAEDEDAKRERKRLKKEKKARESLGGES